MNRPVVAYETIKIDADVNMRYSCCKDYEYFVPAHWHDSMEVLYILDGDLNINIEQMSYSLNAGEFIIIDSNMIHSTYCKTYSHSLIIQIPYLFLKTHIPDIDYMHFETTSSVPGNPLSEQVTPTVPPDTLITDTIRNILNQLTDLWYTKPEGYRLKYYSYIFDLLYIMMQHFKVDITQNEYHQSEKYMERLTSVMSYVKQHYQEDISLQDITEYLALNPSYFARFFKKYMGMTFTEYLSTIRLRAIYEEIITTDLPVQIILERNGFTNYKLFMRMFRQTYGCTPSQKRKEIALANHNHPL